MRTTSYCCGADGEGSGDNGTASCQYCTVPVPGINPMSPKKASLMADPSVQSLPPGATPQRPDIPPSTHSNRPLLPPRSYGALLEWSSVLTHSTTADRKLALSACRPIECICVRASTIGSHRSPAPFSTTTATGSARLWAKAVFCRMALAASVVNAATMTRACEGDFAELVMILLVDPEKS